MSKKPSWASNRSEITEEFRSWRVPKASWRYLGASWPPRRLQEPPRRLQEPPRRVQEAPKRPQEPPRCPQEPPGCVLGGLNPLGNFRGILLLARSWLSWLILASKTPPRASETRSRASKTPPRTSKMPPKTARMRPGGPLSARQFPKSFALGAFLATLAHLGFRDAAKSLQDAFKNQRDASKSLQDPFKTL